MDENSASTPARGPHLLSHDIVMEEDYGGNVGVSSSPNENSQEQSPTEDQLDDAAKAQTQSWVETQNKMQSEPEPQAQSPDMTAGSAQAAGTRGEDAQDSSEHNAAAAAAGNVISYSVADMAPVTGQTDQAMAINDDTSRSKAPAPAPTPAPATVSSVLGGGSRGGRTRAGSTSTGPSIGPSIGPSTGTTTTTPASNIIVPQFVAPSSYLRRKTSNRSAMAHTDQKSLSPLDRDQLQGLVCVKPHHLFLCPIVCSFFVYCPVSCLRPSVFAPHVGSFRTARSRGWACFVWSFLETGFTSDDKSCRPQTYQSLTFSL